MNDTNGGGSKAAWVAEAGCHRTLGFAREFARRPIGFQWGKRGEEPVAMSGVEARDCGPVCNKGKMGGVSLVWAGSKVWTQIGLMVAGN